MGHRNHYRSSKLSDNGHAGTWKRVITYLPHINRYLTTLPNHTRGVIPHHPLLEVREDFRCSDSTQGLGRFVSDHVGFLRVP